MQRIANATLGLIIAAAGAFGAYYGVREFIQGQGSVVGAITVLASLIGLVLGGAIMGRALRRERREVSRLDPQKPDRRADPR